MTIIVVNNLKSLNSNLTGSCTYSQSKLLRVELSNLHWQEIQPSSQRFNYQ